MKNFTANALLIHDITQSIEDVGYAIHTPVDGLDYPSVRLASYEKPGEHGAEISNQLYGGRQVDLTGIVDGSSILEYNQRRRDLQAAFRIIRSNYISLPLLCQFENDDGLQLQFYGYLKEKLKMSERYLNHGDFMVTLFAPDPLLYDQVATSTDINLTEGGGGSGSTFPITFPFVFGAGGGGNSGEETLTNIGDANTYPVVTFYGPLTNPILTNDTLDESFQVNDTIADGDVLVVDMQKKTMVLNGTTNLMSAFDEDNTWLSLIPGDNDFILENDDVETGYVNVTFRNAYIGV